MSLVFLTGVLIAIVLVYGTDPDITDTQRRLTELEAQRTTPSDPQM